MRGRAISYVYDTVAHLARCSTVGWALEMALGKGLLQVFEFCTQGADVVWLQAEQKFNPRHPS
ncbi:hypothetical protein XM38_006770 [Halomicronema hongdechloris C2206]|uniref:Uncharacterized protein n=1 Tax=Halomicronema hongdechloris C2206 TaxID=1641165 RepID=A0A1Z3HHK2_9CYAN|nr:hypothetical protein XM38_006770 [Halomicronema hongdechloris C2206]